MLVDGYNVMLQWVSRVKQGGGMHGLPHLLPAGRSVEAYNDWVSEPLGFSQMRNRCALVAPPGLQPVSGNLRVSVGRRRGMHQVLHQVPWLHVDAVRACSPWGLTDAEVVCWL